MAATVHPQVKLIVGLSSIAGIVVVAREMSHASAAAVIVYMPHNFPNP